MKRYEYKIELNFHPTLLVDHTHYIQYDYLKRGFRLLHLLPDVDEPYSYIAIFEREINGSTITSGFEKECRNDGPKCNCTIDENGEWITGNNPNSSCIEQKEKFDKMNDNDTN